MGEGLHDATWRSKFGSTIYKTSGSHGCVNLPLSAAETIYGIIEAGWPVIVFYTGDTEEEVSVQEEGSHAPRASESGAGP